MDVEGPQFVLNYIFNADKKSKLMYFVIYILKSQWLLHLFIYFPDRAALKSNFAENALHKGLS